MATISPSNTIRTREVIGEDQFSQRREVFDKHDTVFMPASTTPTTPCAEVEPVNTTNRGITTSNFKRNTPTYSSMRESRVSSDREPVEFRVRKYSDNFTSELNQSDDMDYRSSMSERTRRLSKLRREFLASNLHDSTDSPFARKGTRASLPAGKATYKVEIPSLYKFPFAEPFATPPPVRKDVDVDGEEADDKNKENQSPENHPKHQSLPVDSIKIDHHKLFEQLVKRYSPQRKPIDWSLPPTRPKIVGSVTKSVTSNNSDEIKVNGARLGAEDVFSKVDSMKNITEKEDDSDKVVSDDVTPNDESHNSTISITELAEKNDRVPELSLIQRQISREDKRPHVEKMTDLNIPALIEKMNDDGQSIENHKNGNKKVKRKRSFLDKLLGRKKEYVKRQ